MMTKKSRRIIIPLLALVLAVVVLSGCGGGEDKAPAVSAVANTPSVWVINSDLMDSAVYRIDPATNKQVAKIPFDGSPAGIVVTPEGVWVTDFANDKVVCIDPADNSVKATINAGKGAKAITASPGAVWVANSVEGTVTRIDPVAKTVVATINVTNSVLNSLCFFDNALWVAGVDFTVYKIDPQTNQVTEKIGVGTVPGSIAGKSGALWAAAPVANQLLLIDPGNKKVSTVLEEVNVVAIAVRKDLVAVVNGRDGTVSLVNTANNNAKEDIKVGKNLVSIASGYGSLWVTSTDDNALYRIDPVNKSVVATISIGRADRVAGSVNGE